MAITLAVIGPAASVFAIGSVALGQQGSGAFLAFLIAAVISGCLAVGWAELGALYPTAGGLYGIVARVLGRRAGFLALTLQLALFVIVPSAFALAAGQYLAAVWPAINPRAAALVLLAAATALAVAGIRFNAAVTAALLALELAAILVVSTLGLANADWSLAGTLVDPRVYAADGQAAPASLRTLLAGVVLGLGAYAGYGGAVIFSEETRGPRRGIAHAVLGALGIAVVAELLAITAALLGAPSQAQLTTAPAPMSYLIRSLGGDRLVTIVTLALVATFFNILLAGLLEYARILYSSARDRAWPAALSRVLGRIHPRIRTPVVATLAIGVAALTLTAIWSVGSSSPAWSGPTACPCGPCRRWWRWPAWPSPSCCRPVGIWPSWPASSPPACSMTRSTCARAATPTGSCSTHPPASPTATARCPIPHEPKVST
jgi:amino acid transporter